MAFAARNSNKIGWVTSKDLMAYKSERRPDFSYDDLYAIEALEKAGHEIVPVRWEEMDRQALTQLRTEGVTDMIVRTPQSRMFIEQPEKFSDFLKRAAMCGIAVHNNVPLALWGSDKRYLVDLEKAGVPIIPTTLVKQGRTLDLAQYMEQHHLDEIVVKPTVSIGGHHTFRVKKDAPGAHQALSPAQFDKEFTPGDILQEGGFPGPNAPVPTVSQFQQKFDALCVESPMLVQPFIPQIAQGEWSFIFFGGEYSHAVKKIPADGDIFVHKFRGGHVDIDSEPDAALVAQAKDIAAKIRPAFKMANQRERYNAPLYCRLDAIDVGGQLKLVEMEVLEPELFFRKNPAAVDNFVKALDKTVQAQRQAG